ncbi:MAG TPA: hypothetical protein VGC41_02840 [Kofleriaceae bacterium]
MVVIVAVLLATAPAWGHSFPPARSVVAQVEDRELVVMVGYRPGTGEATAKVLAQAANAPESKLRQLRDSLAAIAMAPLLIEVDGHALVPTTVRAKLGVEGGNQRPLVVVLVTYSLPSGDAIAIRSNDPRNTRISWQDRSHGRVDLTETPAQDHWADGVASMLLKLCAGRTRCATATSSVH